MSPLIARKLGRGGVTGSSIDFPDIGTLESGSVLNRLGRGGIARPEKDDFVFVLGFNTESDTGEAAGVVESQVHVDGAVAEVEAGRVSKAASKMKGRTAKKFDDFFVMDRRMLFRNFEIGLAQH